MGIHSRQLTTGTTAAFEILNIAQVAFALFDQIDDKQATESEYESPYLDLRQSFLAEHAKIGKLM